MRIFYLRIISKFPLLYQFIICQFPPLTIFLETMIECNNHLTYFNVVSSPFSMSPLTAQKLLAVLHSTPHDVLASKYSYENFISALHNSGKPQSHRCIRMINNKKSFERTNFSNCLSGIVTTS